MTKGLSALLTLAVLQTAVLGYIALRVSAPTPPSEAPAPAIAAPDPAVLPAAPPRTVNGAAVTAEQVRAIVREEVRALVATAPAAASAAGPQSDSLTPEERRQRAVGVVQQIEYYRSVGNISPAQMHELQSRIATLDPRDRQPMLNRLVAAMNAGEIAGEL